MIQGNQHAFLLGPQSCLPETIPYLWHKGSTNKADYFTKHHPSSHHQQVRSTYLHEPHSNYYACLDDADDDDEGTTDDDADYDYDDITNNPRRTTHVRFMDQPLSSPICSEGVLIPPSHYPNG